MGWDGMGVGVGEGWGEGEGEGVAASDLPRKGAWQKFDVVGWRFVGREGCTRVSNGASCAADAILNSMRWRREMIVCGEKKKWRDESVRAKESWCRVWVCGAVSVGLSTRSLVAVYVR